MSFFPLHPSSSKPFICESVGFFQVLERASDEALNPKLNLSAIKGETTEKLPNFMGMDEISQFQWGMITRHHHKPQKLACRHDFWIIYTPVM